MRLQRAFAARLRRWAARRHGEDRLPHRIGRRRIYILPTRFGAVLAMMLVAMLVAGLNYGSNLALGFAFLMASLAIVAMHHCHRNLLDVVVDVQSDADGFAGGTALLPFTLRNAAGIDRYDLEVRCEGAEPAIVHLREGAAAYVQVVVPCERRGVLVLRQWELRTRFPFGWFRAWTYVHVPLRIHVAPAPRGEREASNTTGAGQGPAGSRQGDEEFAGLREYRPGDALKHMAWKVIARGQPAAVRHYADPQADPAWLDYEDLGGLPAEDRLAQLCRWMLDREARGARYGLRLPGQRVPLGSGAAHRRACLRALAGFTAP